jgi:hypothetical protein
MFGSVGNQISKHGYKAHTVVNSSGDQIKSYPTICIVKVDTETRVKYHSKKELNKLVQSDC